MLMRGIHTCEFCALSDHQWFTQQQNTYGESAHWASLGDGEIRVLGESVVYAAPALIYHYVVEHHYKPPDEFIEAVLAGEPASEQQRELLKKYPD